MNSPSIPPATQPLDGEGAQQLPSRAARHPFEAAVMAVHSRYPALALPDIAFPPAGQREAKAANRLALAITIERLDISIHRLAQELRRSRSVFETALKRVAEQRQEPDFNQDYEALAEQAVQLLQEGEE